MKFDQPTTSTTTTDTIGEGATYDEIDALLCACKGEPYSLVEWEREVARLRAAVIDAERRLLRARKTGFCLPEGLEP